MLDTSVVMMQQYNTAAALSMPMPHLNKNGDSGGVNSTNAATEEAAGEGLVEGTSKLNADSLSTGENSAASSSTTTDPQLPMTKDEEIRKRRLERFQ